MIEEDVIMRTMLLSLLLALMSFGWAAYKEDTGYTILATIWFFIFISLVCFLVLIVRDLIKVGVLV